MRRTELLLESIKRQVESQIDSSGGGISDEEILDHLNSAQFGLYSEIVQSVPDILLVDSFINLVANQESYDLPTDIHLGTAIKSVWYKFGSDAGEYTKIPSNIEFNRDTSYTADFPAFYIRKDNKILINPIPQSALTSGLRLSYQKKVRRLDIRRGRISAISKSGSTLSTLSINLTPSLGKDGNTTVAARNMLNKCDKICVVNKAGRAVLNNIPVDAYNSSTGVLTIGTTDADAAFTTTFTSPDFVNNYIVIGEYSTTHGDFPDETVERYLVAYSTMCLLRRQGNPDEVNMKIQEMQVIKGDILNSYECPDQDIKYLLPDTAWTNGGFGMSPYAAPSGGGGGSGSAASTGANVGLAGVGLFKQLSGTTLQFLNIDVDSGLDVVQDIVNDTVDISLNINELTADTTPLTSDYLLEYDVSASAHKKTLISSLPLQPLDSTLTSIALLGTAADKYLYTTGIDTWAEGTLTTFTRTLLDDTSATVARTTLGVAIGTDVQAYDATLTSIALLGTAADRYLYTTGIDTWAEGTLTTFTRTLLDDTSSTVARTTLGVAIGTDVQAYDATLTNLAALSSAQGDIIYATASDTFTVLNKNISATRYLSNTGTSNNPAWAQIDVTNGITGSTPVPNGGTGLTSATAYAVICGGTSSTAAFQSIAGVGTTGQVLTSNGAGALPTFQTSGTTWTTVTGTSQSAAINSGYVANNAGLVTITLPASASVGDFIIIMGLGAGFYKLGQNAGQTVRVGASSTTTGTGGSLTATKQYQALTVRCLVTNTDWEVTDSTETFTIV